MFPLVSSFSSLGGSNPVSNALSLPSALSHINDDDKVNLMSVCVLTTSFYVSNMVLQRCMGVIKIHGGRHGLVTSTLGCVLTASSLFVAQEVEKYARKRAIENKLIPGSRDTKWGLRFPGSGYYAERDSPKCSTRQVLVGLGVFALLEQGLFRTALPSSVITPGVFANALNMVRRSVAATSAIATESQRQKIQTLGKRFGCHQCGSRQLLSKSGFIADHMPPTKLALEMSQAWWRRLFKIEVKQRLWPQCQKCFQLQGSSVRTWTHALVYHHAFKLYHFSPAIAFVLTQQPYIVEFVDDCVVPMVECVENIKRTETWKKLSNYFRD